MNAMVQSLRELSQGKLAALLGTAALLIGFFIFLSLKAGSPTMSPLYSNVDLSESGQIVAELDKVGVPYKLNMGGAQILVPSDQVETMRVKLASQGLPSSGSIGYEIFDKGEALGTSNFVLNMNKLRALEGELGRTISSLAKVESARVHLVVPKRELFSRDKVNPTASVALKTRSAAPLDKGEIAAIQHLVATAVPDLKTSNITVVDQHGNLLARGGEDANDPGVVASNAQEYRANYESKMKNSIEQLLERSVGVGNVEARVTADIDFDRVVTNSEKFDPEGQVARSVQDTSEKEQSNEKDAKDGTVSVGQQLPDAGKNAAGFTNQSETQRTDSTTNFEISKTVENHIKETGTVNKLSIAVLVDGVYMTDKDGKQTYAPRDAAQITQLAALVKSAVGYDESRGDKVEVVNMPFSKEIETVKESPFDFLKQDMGGIIQTLVIGGVAVLVILLIVRPMVSRVIAPPAGESEEEELQRALLTAPNVAGRLPDFSGMSGEPEEDTMVTIARVDGAVRSSTLKRIHELLENHPDEAIMVLRQWAFDDAGGNN